VFFVNLLEVVVVVDVVVVVAVDCFLDPLRILEAHANSFYYCCCQTILAVETLALIISVLFLPQILVVLFKTFLQARPKIGIPSSRKMLSLLPFSSLQILYLN